MRKNFILFCLAAIVLAAGMVDLMGAAPTEKTGEELRQISPNSACSRPCALMGMSCCGSDCRNLKQDPRHCGKCGNVCTGWRRCVNGYCVCNFGSRLCNGNRILGGSDKDLAKSIQQTRDEGYVLAGITWSNDGDVSGNHGRDDAWIVKLNKFGAVEWKKCLGGLLNDSAYSIQQTKDDGYIVAGATLSNDGDVSSNHGGLDAWVIKLDKIGRVQWKKCLGGLLNDSIYTVQQTSDGGYILAGDTRSSDGDVSGNHGRIDAWVVKLSELGAIQWQKCLGGSSDDGAIGISQTTDGGYIVAGDTRSNDGGVSGYHGGSGDIWVVKLDKLGVMQWQKCYGSSGSDKIWIIQQRSIQQTIDRGYILIGTTWSNDGDFSDNHGGGDFWVAKLDRYGAPQWHKCLGGSDNEWGGSIQQTTDGGYLVAGIAKSDDGDVSGNHGDADAWVFKLNKFGAVQWQRCFGGSSDDEALGIQQTTDNGYVFVGVTGSHDGEVIGNHIGPCDIWMVKMPPT